MTKLSEMSPLTRKCHHLRTENVTEKDKMSKGNVQGGNKMSKDESGNVQEEMSQN